MSEATSLLRLQEIDLSLMRLRKAADQLPQRAKVAAARAASKKVASELTKIVGQRKDVEIDLADLDERKAMLSDKVSEVQADASASADHRAAQDLELSLSSLAKKLEKADFDAERLLEKLETVERAERNARSLAERLAAEEKAQTDAWREAAADITSQVKELTSERERVVATISPELMGRYDEARKRFGGLAVETLEGNRPSACRVALQPSSFSDIRRSDSDITTCPYCRRILVVSREA